MLGNAITFAIQGQATSPDREMAPGMIAGGEHSTAEVGLNSSGTPSGGGGGGGDTAPV